MWRELEVLIGIRKHRKLFATIKKRIKTGRTLSKPELDSEGLHKKDC